MRAMVGREEGSEPGPLAGLHVLVVDDNRDARVIYKSLLVYCGAYVTTIASAAAAARALRQIRPDIILTDLSMPGHDGIWLARWLRRRETKTGVHIPIAALTARDDIYDRDSTMRTGLDDWLVKPVSHRELLRVVTRLTAPVTPVRSA
jgi:CheY-like chemotaxis protein